MKQANDYSENVQFTNTLHEIGVLDIERSAFDSAMHRSKETLQSLDAVLETSSSIHEEHLKACLDLVTETSSADYKASSKGWSPRRKWQEMKEKGMRYILLFGRGASPESNMNEKGNDIFSREKPRGFLSYMFIEEDRTRVCYIYEIHISSSVRGKGVGKLLMDTASHIACMTKMYMTALTVFTSNEAAIKFYEHLGYTKWDEEPLITKTRRLRSGTKEIKPSYLILTKLAAAKT